MNQNHPTESDEHSESLDSQNGSSADDLKIASQLDEALADGFDDQTLSVRLQHELLQANERVLRAQADLENFRKRTRRDYEDQLKYSNLPLLREMLAVLDNLRRASASATGNEQAANLRSGVDLVIKQFESVLQKYQCAAIPSVGEAFDPNYHEAISQMPHDEIAAGFVAFEVVTGYQLADRVVRPSQVIVSSGPPVAS